MNKYILAICLFGLVTSGCPAIKYVNGGLSGSGFASRYWDCCKPSCAHGLEMQVMEMKQENALLA